MLPSMSNKFLKPKKKNSFTLIIFYHLHNWWLFSLPAQITEKLIIFDSWNFFLTNSLPCLTLIQSFYSFLSNLDISQKFKWMEVSWINFSVISLFLRLLTNHIFYCTNFKKNFSCELSWKFSKWRESCKNLQLLKKIVINIARVLTNYRNGLKFQKNRQASHTVDKLSSEVPETFKNGSKHQENR